VVCSDLEKRNGRPLSEDGRQAKVRSPLLPDRRTRAQLSDPTAAQQLGHNDSRDQPNNWEKDAHFTNRDQSRLEYDWHGGEPVYRDLLGGRCDRAQASLISAQTLG